MAEWIKLTEAPVADFVPAAKATLEQAQTALEFVQVSIGVLEELAVLLNLIFIDDPVAALLRGLEVLLKENIEGLLTAGVGFFPIAPKTPADLLHPFDTGTAMLDAAFQAQDPLDSNRPSAAPNSAYAGLVVLAGADYWADFRALLDALDALFGKGATAWGAFSKLQLKIRDSDLVARTSRASSGAPWDWSRFKLLDLPPLRRAFLPILTLLDQLANTLAGFAAFIDAAGAVLSERIYYIRKLLASLEEVVEFLQAFNTIMVNAHVLPFAAETGGAQAAAAEWINASNEPQLQLVSGFILMAEGPNAAASVGDFVKLLGIQEQRITTLFEQVHARAAAAQAEAE